jgi:gluconokinase
MTDPNPAPPFLRAIAVVMMGVSGAGKTTVGAILAERLDAEFLEGDRFHPPANIVKMSRGEALDDGDRAPWLDRLGEELAHRVQAGRRVVLTCSALKRSYRDRLRHHCPSVRFVYLRGEKRLIRARLDRRTHHFMPAALLDSQFMALEAPAVEEHAVTADISSDPEAVVDAVMARLSGPAVRSGSPR